MRRAARKDAIHAAASRAWRAAGWSTLDTSRLGHGAPDEIVSLGPIAAAVEYKTASGRKTADDRLRAGQKAFRTNWRGLYLTIQTLEELQIAIAYLAALHRRFYGRKP